MIGVAVIGYGYWGPNMARCFAETEGCSLVSIADRSADALARAAKRHPYARLTSDWRDAIIDPKVDAVVVATPVTAHFEIALAALQAGRQVLVEKPMTATSEQARILVDLADRRGLILMVDHTFVYSSAVQKMKELIDAEALGQVYYYDSTRINLGQFQRDVNVIWDLAVHDLSIVRHILDSTPAAISATGAMHVPGTPENMAQVSVRLENGAVAYLNVNWLAPLKVRRALVGGASKMIVWDDLEPTEKIKVYDRSVSLTDDPEQIHEMRVNYRIGDMWAPKLSTSEPLQTEAAHFVACIDQRLKPITDGSMGLGVVEMLEAATRSMRMHGQVVEFGARRRAS
jgi:predicted dehydrogenase